MKNGKQAAKETTLMLLYLLSWEEGPKGMEYHRSWKGYDFGILNELEEEGLIYGSHRAKSVALDENAVEQAKALLMQYGIEEKNQKIRNATAFRIFTVYRLAAWSRGRTRPN